MIIANHILTRFHHSSGKNLSSLSSHFPRIRHFRCYHCTTDRDPATTYPPYSFRLRPYWEANLDFASLFLISHICARCPKMVETTERAFTRCCNNRRSRGLGSRGWNSLGKFLNPLGPTHRKILLGIEMVQELLIATYTPNELYPTDFAKHLTHTRVPNLLFSFFIHPSSINTNC